MLDTVRHNEPNDFRKYRYLIINDVLCKKSGFPRFLLAFVCYFSSSYPSPNVSNISLKGSLKRFQENSYTLFYFRI